MKRWLIPLAALILVCAAGPAAADETPNYLADVREGEWALYRTDTGNLQKSTVIDVTDAEAVFLDETIIDGKTVRERKTRLNLAEGMPDLTAGGAEPRVKEGKVTVLGREMDCKIVEIKADARLLRLFMTPDIPVMGLARMEVESGGKVIPMLTLVEYGTE